jgi:6-phosphogluconate dehydrogenase
MATAEKTIAFIGTHYYLSRSDSFTNSGNVGLGVMGYPMALNLRKKVGSEYTILICDVVQDALQKFQEEAAGTGPIEVVQTGYEAVQAAVHIPYSTLFSSEIDYN